MRFVIGHQSDRGLVRETNEDAFFVSDRCLAVADGMGGHRAGEVASKMAMDVLDALESMPSTDSGWRDLVVQINRAVLDAARLDRRYRGMGTTLTLAALVDVELAVVHVGDSRAYVACGGRIKQLTEDHSLVQTLVSAGTITEEEAMRHHSRNVITSAIGVEGDLRIDVVRTKVRPSDVVVVCTDGLSSLVTGKEILAMITEATRSAAPDDCPQVVADMLVSKALERGGYDNVTAIVGRVEP